MSDVFSTTASCIETLVKSTKVLVIAAMCIIVTVIAVYDPLVVE